MQLHIRLKNRWRCTCKRKHLFQQLQQVSNALLHNTSEGCRDSLKEKLYLASVKLHLVSLHFPPLNTSSVSSLHLQIV